MRSRTLFPDEDERKRGARNAKHMHVDIYPIRGGKASKEAQGRLGRAGHKPKQPRDLKKAERSRREGIKGLRKRNNYT